jgi:putative ABC transport system ATP-binding protein
MTIASVPEGAAVIPSATLAGSDLTRRYGEGDSAVDALRGVSLEIPDRQFAAVMGPSGSGKSTLMHILAGLDAPTSGLVWVGGEEITSMGDDEAHTAAPPPHRPAREARALVVAATRPFACG